MRPFAMLCAAGALAIFGTTMAKSPALPLFAAHLGATPTGIGLVAALSPLAGVFASAPAGVLSDCLGRRRLLLVAGLVFATAPFGYLLATEIWHLALVRFYHGLATGIFMPVAMAMVTDLYATERGLRLGGMSTATLIGRFAAPLAGGLFIGLGGAGSRLGYDIVYWGCALAGAASFALILLTPAPTECRAKGGNAFSFGALASGLREALRVRPVLAGCVMEAALLFAFGVFEVFFPLRSAAAGFSSPAIGALLSAQVIALAATKPYFGRLSDRRGRRGQILTGCAALGFCLAALSFATHPVVLVLACMGVGLALSVATSATSAFIADASPEGGRGAAMGLLGSIMDVGHSMGPLLGGIVAAALGYASSFWLGVAVLGAALIVFASMTSREGGVA